MSIQSFDAMSAYARTAGIAPAAMPPVANEAGNPGASFSKMVESAVVDASQAVRASEAVATQAVQGKADMVDVVTAMNSAEMAMETVVAVRDKVIAAYQDIMRMPI
ncbi:MAG: flagellar hook-basal body complex protein FliE [Pacificimonas sp.]